MRPVRDNRHVADVEGIRYSDAVVEMRRHPSGPREPSTCSGVSTLLYACFNCGRRWHAGDKP